MEHFTWLLMSPLRRRRTLGALWLSRSGPTHTPSQGIFGHNVAVFGGTSAATAGPAHQAPGPGPCPPPPMLSGAPVASAV